jgi:CRISPR-associated endonuclease/helicase Cas3
MRRFQSALRNFGLLINADRDSAARYAPEAFEISSPLRGNDIERFKSTAKLGGGSAAGLAMARQAVYESAVRVASSRAEQSALWSLSVPTGAGKTIAAIGWAARRRERRSKKKATPIIYALPFTSIIDQNAAVLRAIIGAKADESVLSVHHHLSEPGEIALRGEQALSRVWTEGWRADVVCTTFVQICAAMFHATPADSRRFSRLAGAILILDEVQAIPADLWPLMREALRSLKENLGTEILLVTATQPALIGKDERIEIAPDLSEFSREFNRYDIHVQGNPVDLDWLADEVLASARADPSRSILVILNTIRDALTLVDRVVGAASLERDVLHLSTNLRPMDRGLVIERVKQSARPVLLISTQVVEAGVDLSFPVVYRALAPLDSVIQSAGRCNRHGAGPRGVVHVFDLRGGSADLVYGRVHMSLARELLTNQTIAEPAVAALVEHYFAALEARLGFDDANLKFEAIANLQFAALRGEGEDRDRQKKEVRLISDDRDRVAHFVELTSGDSAIWDRLVEALSDDDVARRRTRVRQLRRLVGERVVDVPRRDAMGEPDELTGMVRVSPEHARHQYDTRSGWRRGL